MPKRGLEPVAILLLALFWGLNWPAIRTALHEISPWMLRVIGMGAGALFLFCYAVVTGQRGRLARQDWLPVLAGGFLSITAFNLLLSFAQLAGPTSRAVIVTFAMPIWTVLFARWFLGERLDRRRWLGLGFGALGLGCLGWPLLAGGTLGLGVALSLLAGMSWALGTVVMKRFPVSARPVTITAVQLAAGALVALLGVVVFEPQVLRAEAGWQDLQLRTWIALGHHILLSQSLAYLLWYWLLARIPAGTASLTLLLVPAIGVASSMALLGERPTLTDALGLALITAAATSVMWTRSPPRPS